MESKREGCAKPEEFRHESFQFFNEFSRHTKEKDPARFKI